MLTHLPKPFFAFVFVPQSSLKAAEPIVAFSALQNFAGFTLPPVGGGVVSCARLYVVPLTVIERTSTVCTLPVCFHPPSTANWMPVTVCEPSRVTASAHVEHTLPPASCEVSTRQASLVPTRLPESIHVAAAQPVNDGDGPR